MSPADWQPSACWGQQALPMSLPALSRRNPTRRSAVLGPMPSTSQIAACRSLPVGFDILIEPPMRSPTSSLLRLVGGDNKPYPISRAVAVLGFENRPGVRRFWGRCRRNPTRRSTSQIGADTVVRFAGRVRYPYRTAHPSLRLVGDNKPCLFTPFPGFPQKPDARFWGRCRRLRRSPPRRLCGVYPESRSVAA